MILSAYPEWRLLVLGEEDTLSIMQIENEISYHPQILFMGEKSNNEVKKFLENAVISYVPSKWEEPLSLCVMESLVVECALITSKRGGIP